LLFRRPSPSSLRKLLLLRSAWLRGSDVTFPFS
jgi:hypothetical protein